MLLKEFQPARVPLARNSLLPEKMTTGWTPPGCDQNDGFWFCIGFLLFNDISGGGASGAVVGLVAGWEWW